MAEKSKDLSKAATTVYNDYISNCRRRNIFFELTKEQLSDIIQKNCHYCDAPPSNLRRGKLPYNGIDRIDHKKGYTPGNCLPACSECNRLRSDLLTVEEMEIVAKALKVFRLGQSG